MTVRQRIGQFLTDLGHDQGTLVAFIFGIVAVIIVIAILLAGVKKRNKMGPGRARRK